MTKPQLTLNQYQQLLKMNQVHLAMNAARRDSFFRGSAFVGGDPFADARRMNDWACYGFSMDVDFYMLFQMYERCGIAKAGVDIPVNLCWMDSPTIRSGDDDEHKENAWEIKANSLAKRLKLWRHLRDADRMQRVGRYSAIFIRIRDGQAPDKPLSKVNESQIIELMPLWEGQLEPNDIDQDLFSDNYNKPLNYTYSSTGTGNKNDKAADSFVIHHSRLLILSEDAVAGSIYGTPANKAGFNALLTWEKIMSSGGEATRLSAANKQILSPSEPGRTMSAETLDGIDEALGELRDGYANSLFLNGATATPMSNTVPDAAVYKEMALQDYSASVGLPAKEVVGSQSGVKAGDEDTAGLMRKMQSRRKGPCTDYADSWLGWCYKYGVLVMPQDGHVIAWSDLTAPSAGQKIDAALKMAQVNVQGRAGEGLVFTTDEIRKEAGYEALTEEFDEPDETMPDDEAEQGSA